MNKGLEWDGLPVPLAWLAELDGTPCPGALADAFGDRYLCTHNPTFAKIRRSALESGCRFSADDTPMWRDYQAFSLTTLHTIVSGGVIPYHDTGNTFCRMLQVNPKAALSPRFILANLKRNYVFHESAHCVASSILRRMDSAMRTIAADDRERFVLEGILAESFANTVETIGSLVRRKPLSDMLFYSLNSYMIPKREKTAKLEEAVAKTGEYSRFALLFLAFFEANLTGAGPGESVCERIALAGNCGTNGAEIVGLIGSCAFDLSMGFRGNTTPAYFEFLGYGKEYMALANARWLGMPDNRELAGELISSLYEAAIGSPAVCIQ